MKNKIIFRDSYDDLPEIIKDAGLETRKFYIVSDSNVAPLYLDAVKKTFKKAPSFIFEAGEARKHLDTVNEMYKCFQDDKLDRKSVIIALGGGVAGDMAGFAAATYMRGISVIQLPTSLLAMVDASAGGKTGVNFMGVKNLIGAFHQPELVYINISALKTLPEDEFISGLGEVVKHGLIGGGGYYDFLYKNRSAIKNIDIDVMLETVSGSCRIKSAVVEKDEKETGLRETLNFGHCVGHAVESLSNYTIPHGKCVSMGMCAALRLSSVPKDEYKKAAELMEFFGLPVKIEISNPKEIVSTMYKDKKTQSDTLRVVLLKKIGEAYTDSTLTDEKITECLYESY